MFAYCRNNPVSRIDIAGYADTDIEEEHDDEIEVVPKVPVVAGGGGIGGGTSGGVQRNDSSFSTSNQTITLYRAVCPQEYTSSVQQQQFSTVETGSSTGKYFTTSYDYASQWGHAMYPNNDFVVMKATLDKKILSSCNTMIWPNLDSIGPAYFFDIYDLNLYMVNIS